MTSKSQQNQIPATTPPKRTLTQKLKRFLGQSESNTFESSRKFWEDRYRLGGHSGRGSYGALASYKATFLNEFVKTKSIESVVEFGCGDGNQLSLTKYPSYLGLDVSPTAIKTCRSKFQHDETKSFGLLEDHVDATADLTLSLNVIHHLVEDNIFENHMQAVFASAIKYVVIYSSNFDQSEGLSDHVRHRQFTNWVKTHEPEWSSPNKIENPSELNDDPDTQTTADFYVFSKVMGNSGG